MIKSVPGVLFAIAFSLFMTLIVPNVFVSLRLLFVVPPCIFALYIFSSKNALWTAFLLGCFLDAIQYTPLFGMLGLCFLLTQIFLLRLRQFFFQDLLSTLFILTFLFSSISTLLKGVFILLLGFSNPFTISWILSDVLFMPCVDAIYAFICFSMPITWLQRRRMRGGET